MSHEEETESGISLKDLGIDPEEAKRLERTAQKEDSLRTRRATVNRNYNNPPPRVGKSKIGLMDETLELGSGEESES